MKNCFLYIVIIISFAGSLNAQEMANEDYAWEFNWGITKATNSGIIGGGILKYAVWTKDRVYQSFGFEFVNINHHQENKYNTFYGRFISWGKVNHLYSMRFQYGREWVLFKKAPYQGVQINGRLAGGPSFGLLVPYYIEIHTDRFERVPYDPDVNYDRNNVVGPGGIFRGWSDTNMVPGVNAKASLSFEFSATKNNVVGLETGFMVEVFRNEMEILANKYTENSNFFPNAFVTLYYGSRR